MAGMVEGGGDPVAAVVEQKQQVGSSRNKQVIFRGFISGTPKETDMEVKVCSLLLLRRPPNNAVVVKNLYLSCDPYMRGRMLPSGSHLPPFPPASVIEGLGVSRVVESDNPNFKPGDYVSGMTGWEEYSFIENTQHLRKIHREDDIPLSYHIGLLGMPGFTAYAGFYEVCSPKKGEHVFVSAASGAVGQLVGQLAKLNGCRVVGSAGSGLKVDLLKNKLGFDEAFNYKEEQDFNSALKRYFPEGIDIYFDNVGGEMLDAALLNMRVHGRIAVCGMISQHSLIPRGIHNLFNLVIKRIRMQGFLQSDYSHLFPRFLEDMSSYHRQGKIVYIEDMIESLESAPAAFVRLFSGENVGKQVICVARD